MDVKTINSAFRSHRSAAGFTLIEIIIHVTVISIALAGTMALFNSIAAKSSESLEMRKVQEAGMLLLDEIGQMAYTYCAASDSAAADAASPSACSVPQLFAAPAGKSRFANSGASPFDNVGDYAGYSQSPPTDILQNTLPNLSGYTLSVSVANPPAPLGPIGAGGSGLQIPASEIALVTVTITNNSTGKSWPFSAYRFRHSPNALP